MLRHLADGVLVNESEFLQSNTVLVGGDDGALLVDPGITADELAALAHDIRARGIRVEAGFSTHPDWDHLLWHSDFGDVPRYATVAGAVAVAEFLAHDDWRDQLADFLPPEHADDIPLDLLGLVTAVPSGAREVPWSGPVAHIIEHRAHAPGHAALLLPDSGVLIAGDMLSDILMPFFDLRSDHPLEDYLAALDLFDDIADRVRTVVPGHGNVGGQDELHARIALDRRYVEAVAAGREPDDPRIGPSAALDWLPAVHEGQLQRLAARSGRTSGA